MLKDFEIDLIDSLIFPFSQKEEKSKALREQEHAIEYSNKLIDFLTGKVSEHNGSCKSKININQLKSIFIDAFDSCPDENKLSCAIGKVNVFLEIKSEGFSKKYYDKNLCLKLTDETIVAAENEVEKSELKDFPFSSLEELYINECGPLMLDIV
jgi:hypothetical protein